MRCPIRFHPMEPFHVKGKQQLIRAFQPKYTDNALTYSPQSHYYNIGRESYLKLVEQLLFTNSSFVLLTESPIGSGKTYYMESIVNLIQKKIKLDFGKYRIIWASGHHYVHSPHTIGR